MSSLWTPGGEIPVTRGSASSVEPGPPQPQSAPTGQPDEPGISLDDLSPEERLRAEQMIAEMAEVQRQIAEAPAAVVVANHIMGLFELAAIHLNQPEPKWPEAQLAIDAMKAMLEAVGDRLGEPGLELREALRQVQLAFVQRRAEGESPSARS